MKSILLSVLVLTAVFISRPSVSQPAAEATVSNYTDTQYKFSISPPAFPQGNAPMVVPVVFAGPSKDRFSANVTVMIQENQPAKDAYLQTTSQQIENAGGKINSSKALKIGDNEAQELDYEVNNMNNGGQDMRFLALAVFKEGRVYLVTCTSLAASFEKNQPEFQKCIDSFKLN
jgi:hypothetical protein